MSVVRVVLNFLYEVFLGCSHQHLTRPFTLEHETYMVCLDCGKQIYYSFDTMHTLSAREVRRIHAASAGEIRVMPASVSGPILTADARKSDAA